MRRFDKDVNIIKLLIYDKLVFFLVSFWWKIRKLKWFYFNFQDVNLISIDLRLMCKGSDWIKIQLKNSKILVFHGIKIQCKLNCIIN